MTTAPKQYFTRLTPNFSGWRKPSGKDGKCRSADPTKKLYEELHGFGWEEWLFHFIEHIDGYCYGFLQCFNTSKRKNKIIPNLHLYTRVRSNNTGAENYYVGLIQQLEVLGKEYHYVLHQVTLSKEKMMKDSLIKAGVVDSDKLFEKMKAKNKVFNVRFKKSDVTISKTPDKKIKLPHGYYRFKLYDITEKKNLLLQIAKIS